MSRILKFLRQDLQEYLGEDFIIPTMEECGREAKGAWLASDPQGAQAANAFYLNTAHYLSECTDWYARDRTLLEATRTLFELARRLRWNSVLDYGAGIATHSLALAEQNIVQSVTLADFNCPALGLASWKAEKYNLPVYWQLFDPVLMVQPIISHYDCIICFDVIGHSLAPFEVLAEILSHGHYIMWNSDFRIQDCAKDDKYPMHQLKPLGWNRIWSKYTKPIASFIYQSKCFGARPSELVEIWKREISQ